MKRAPKKKKPGQGRVGHCVCGYTHGHADRTTLSDGRSHRVLLHDLPSRRFRLAQLSDVEQERFATLRPVSLLRPIRVGLFDDDVVHRQNVYLPPAVTARRLFRSGVSVVNILKTGRQHFHHLVGSVYYNTNDVRGENNKKNVYYINIRPRNEKSVGPLPGGVAG